jgi:hypothetical protein
MSTQIVEKDYLRRLQRTDLLFKWTWIVIALLTIIALLYFGGING